MKKNTKTKSTAIRLPASRAHIWAHCGGSVKLKNTGNPFEDKSIRAKGILTHNIAAQVLEGERNAKKTTDGKACGHTEIKMNAWEKQLHAANLEEITDSVAFYLNLISEKFADFKDKYPDATMHVEETLRIEKNGYVFEGPPDVYFLSKKFQAVHVFDLKSGWMEVEAEGNEQLILYCHSIAYLHKFKTPVLKGTIAQPLLSQVANASYFFDSSFFDSIAVDLKRFSVGAHCTKCPALTSCKTAKEKIEFFNNSKFADDTVAREKYFPELLTIAKAGEEFFKRIQQEAKAILELGGTIEGWTLGKGKAGKRVWAEAVTKNKLSEITGIEPGMLVEEKLLSPKGVEDMLKGKKEEKDALKALYYQPVYPTLVRVSSDEAFMNVKQIKDDKAAAKEKKKLKGGKK